ncbi:hypothetical protein SAMN05421783_12068 [Thiocapsa roseopersicina]|uniref:Uncharacterized protein n=1 Tax=Thiocapsa roseopersicina TaxID=1058 RepID=A0A1H3APT3_THIRO|nr:hypothetical protein SAMN05421783_12068 [Thiocapsa roseopersicina]
MILPLKCPRNAITRYLSVSALRLCLAVAFR